jgi:hypothetical protein
MILPGISSGKEQGSWGSFMRGALRMFGLIIAFATVLGCHHDKYNIRPPQIEEYYLPPDEARYNLPDTAPYRKPPAEKEEKTLLGRPGNGPGGTGGMGGGF